MISGGKAFRGDAVVSKTTERGSSPRAAAIDLGIDNVVKGFQGPHRWLSNFHPSLIRYEGLTLDSVEHAYQSAKCADAAERHQFRHITPGQAKRLGRRVHIRSDWEDVREQVMLDCLRLKFQWPLLRMNLLATEDAILVEWNTWGDTFWGVTDKGGDNRLGKILMQVRSEISE